MILLVGQVSRDCDEVLWTVILLQLREKTEHHESKGKEIKHLWNVLIVSAILFLMQNSSSFAVSADVFSSYETTVETKGNKQG